MELDLLQNDLDAFFSEAILDHLYHFLKPRPAFPFDDQEQGERQSRARSPNFRWYQQNELSDESEVGVGVGGR